MFNRVQQASNIAAFDDAKQPNWGNEEVVRWGLANNIFGDPETKNAGFAQSRFDAATSGRATPQDLVWLDRLATLVKQGGKASSKKGAIDREGLGVIEDVLRFARQERREYPAMLFDPPNVRSKVRIHLTGHKAKRPNIVTITDGRQYPNNIFYGTIESGQFMVPRGRIKDRMVNEFLYKLASDLPRMVVDEGHKTGWCSCCGKRLEGVALDRGVHAHCAKTYGIDDEVSELVL